MSRAEIILAKHGAFFRRCLDGLPEQYEGLDTSR